MIKLRCDEKYQPKYMTAHSAACDLYAREGAIIEPQQVIRVPVGVWIDSVDWNQVPEDCIPELQVRARSGLSFKNSIMLANGVGTVDADYPDEIGVLLYNGGLQSFEVTEGMRIAQIALNLVHRIPHLDVGGVRTGGFGSTKV
ncbi:dUTP diphosphatase [Pseudobacteriovorax antillogorgiicola]|uniref:dUTP diphosphatase n=1 Tax=Pseudobacteriovorax antillogorgiicola TaxID=1513793 RepID=A0A1Y6B296_9BACT|nr:dUTP diphosphatase [Pseudobacteriovorax antillogorgiicola]TCS59517.1 dUTP pyrophosphatase [Pseudobacteriovorax antillogorgiicola]SME87869.1 dUTP pyrophosphatase [Pseudobacteriovorax antillogorgiicola]